MENAGNGAFSVPKEVSLAVNVLRENGIGGEIRTAAPDDIPKFVEDLVREAAAAGGGVLYITDDAEVLHLLLQAGLPVCAYENADNADNSDVVDYSANAANAGNSGNADNAESLEPSDTVQLEKTGNKASLGEASYIVSGPDEIAPDDYCKIYERLTDQPWTILATDRILVRETAEADMDGLYGCYDEEALRFVEGLPSRELQREAMRSYREKVYGFYGFGQWSLIDRESGQFAGLMGYEPFRRGEEAVSFGYILHPDFRGKGYAFEAGKAILEYGKNVLGFSAVQAAADRENIASVSLLERLGFKRLQTQEKGGKIEEIYFISFT